MVRAERQLSHVFGPLFGHCPKGKESNSRIATQCHVTCGRSSSKSSLDLKSLLVCQRQLSCLLFRGRAKRFKDMWIAKEISPSPNLKLDSTLL